MEGEQTDTSAASVSLDSFGIKRRLRLPVAILHEDWG